MILVIYHPQLNEIRLWQPDFIFNERGVWWLGQLERALWWGWEVVGTL